MNPDKVRFLRDLADLMECHNASMYYTIHQDGIEIEVDGDHIFADWLYEPRLAVKALRDRADDLEKRYYT